MPRVPSCCVLASASKLAGFCGRRAVLSAGLVRCRRMACATSDLLAERGRRRTRGPPDAGLAGWPALRGQRRWVRASRTEPAWSTGAVGGVRSGARSVDWGLAAWSLSFARPLSLRLAIAGLRGVCCRPTMLGAPQPGFGECRHGSCFLLSFGATSDIAASVLFCFLS